MARDIISGDAGTTWTNDTGRVRYQFVAALINTCGTCLQYHLKISTSWPIPIHYKCRCIQVLIKPGAEAPKPFCDFRELLDSMDDSQKVAAIGMSNYRLLKSGVVKWDDIVSPNRVRDFREVVAKKKLTVDQMVKHGVKRYQAEKAYNAVHTAEHEHVERQRRELLGQLTGAGLSQENLVRELGNRLAARVTIAPGPSGPYTEGPAWGGGPLPGVGPSSAAALAAMISGWRPPKTKAAMPKPKVEPKPKEKEKPAKPEEPIPVHLAEPEQLGETLPPRIEIATKTKAATEPPIDLKPEGLVSFPGNGNLGGEKLPPKVRSREKKASIENDVTYVRAPAGGAVSDVNGQHYKGGQLMPVHGLSEKTAKGIRTGLAGSGPAKPNENKEKPAPRRQFTPQEIADQVERRRREKEWQEARDSKAGELFDIGGRPHVIKHRIATKDWKNWVVSQDGRNLEEVSRISTDLYLKNATSNIKEHVRDDLARKGMSEEDIRRELLDDLKRQTEFSESLLSKAHVKKYPYSAKALTAANEAVVGEPSKDQARDIIDIGKAMAALKP